MNTHVITLFDFVGLVKLGSRWVAWTAVSVVGLCQETSGDTVIDPRRFEQCPYTNTIERCKIANQERG